MNKRHQEVLKRHQSGVATLIVILILLFSITGITLYSAQSGVMEQKVAANDYRAKQLQEAADAGLDYALSWLTMYKPIWTTYSASLERDSSSISTSIGNYTVSVILERPVADPKKVTIYTTANETGNTKLTASSQTTIVQKKLIGGDPQSAMMINGCMTGVTGTPDATNLTGGNEIVSSQDNSSGTCIDPGHLNDPNPPLTIDDNSFTGTAWDNVFGISQSEMQTLAGLDPNVYWITQNTPWVLPSNPLGSPANPVIVVMTDCAKLMGTGTLYGILYYSTPCGAPGWGGVEVYGSVIFEGDVTDLNANALVTYDPSFIAGFANKTSGVQNRAPGSWIDR